MPDPQTLALMAVLIVMIGALAGLLAGLFGVGGGIVLVPAFFYAFGQLGFGGPMLMQLCIATSLATIVVTSARSALAHHRRGAVDWDLVRLWAPAIAIGAVGGVILATELRSVTLQAIFGGLATLVALYLTFGRDAWRLRPTLPDPPAGWALGGALGFVSVLMGIGGGTFGVPMLSLFGVAMHRAVATAAAFGVVIAVPSVIGFLFLPLPPDDQPPGTIGAINLPTFVLVITMTLLTATWGAALAHRTQAARLKRLFGLFLALVGLNMLRKAVGW